MAWFYYSLIAAVLWGMSYVLSEQVLKTISPASGSFFTAIGACVVYLIISITQEKSLSHDWAILKQGGKEAWFTLVIILCVATANFLTMNSMKQKNATLAGLVEISYPLFTALFAYVLFRQVQMNTGTMAGAALIMAGAGCIYFFNR